MEIAFRVDASRRIGTGHVMRCLALADALKANGAVCYFVSREHPGHLFELIRRRGHALIPLSQAIGLNSHRKDILTPYTSWLGCDCMQDVEKTCTGMATIGVVDWLVVDHYAIGSEWERALKSRCHRLMVIDDLANRSHSCDLLLDQTFGRHDSDYAPWVSKRCQLLMGAQYALLRPEFAALRKYSLKRRENPQLRHILVAMGGVDEDNVTGLALDALNGCDLSEDVKITVMMGSNAPWLKAVKRQAASLLWETSVLVDVGNVARLMADTDLAIGAAGSTAWERCCLGVPSIIMILADNQRGIAQALQCEGAADVLNDLETARVVLPELISRYRMCPTILSAVSHAAMGVTDGNGVQRILRHMGF